MSTLKAELCDECFDASYTSEGDQHCVICNMKERITSLKLLCHELNGQRDIWPEETQKLWRENMSE